MAEAFARKGWSGDGQGFYGFVGGRQSVRKERLLAILYNIGNQTDVDKSNDWVWTKTLEQQFQAFAQMDILVNRERANLIAAHAHKILYTPS